RHKPACHHGFEGSWLLFWHRTSKWSSFLRFYQHIAKDIRNLQTTDSESRSLNRTSLLEFLIHQRFASIQSRDVFSKIGLHQLTHSRCSVLKPQFHTHPFHQKSELPAAVTRSGLKHIRLHPGYPARLLKSQRACAVPHSCEQL